MAVYCKQGMKEKSMKIGTLQSYRISNPVLRYKLDPGEPGLATPSKASDSIARVALHEATNLRRFKREAAEDGGIVVYSAIGLNIKFSGSFLSAVSGKSKALIIQPVDEAGNPDRGKTPLEEVTGDNNKHGDSLTGDISKPVDIAEGTAGGTLENTDIPDTSEATGSIKSDELMQVEIPRIEAELNDLRREKVQLENSLSDNASPLLEQQHRQVTARIRLAEQALLEKQQKAMFDQVMTQQIHANRLLPLIYSLENPAEPGINLLA
jgi:hypothetical protein